MGLAVCIINVCKIVSYFLKIYGINYWNEKEQVILISWMNNLNPLDLVNYFSKFLKYQILYKNQFLGNTWFFISIYSKMPG